MSFFDLFFPIKIKYSAQTDTGQKRAHNEDSIAADAKNNLFIVADGLGGHMNGEYASAESINIVQQTLNEKNEFEEHPLLNQVDYDDASDIGSHDYPQINQLIHAIELANRHIHDKNQEIIARKKKPMGTTFSGCWFLTKKKKVILFNVGDSRVYLYRDGEFTQKSHDHSLLQYWIDNGCKGDKPNANVIIRAIGPRSEVQPDIELMDIQRGDCWLICSDGLHGMLDDNEIKDFLSSRLEDKNLSTYKNFSQRLVDKANYAGGLDNISVILVHII